MSEMKELKDMFIIIRRFFNDFWTLASSVNILSENFVSIGHGKVF